MPATINFRKISLHWNRIISINCSFEFYFKLSGFASIRSIYATVKVSRPLLFNSTLSSGRRQRFSFTVLHRNYVLITLATFLRSYRYRSTDEKNPIFFEQIVSTSIRRTTTHLHVNANSVILSRVEMSITIKKYGIYQ